jgi:anti-sigma factor RsiW
MDIFELLDYALGRLEGSRRAHLEQQMAEDPELARRVARLLRFIDRLLDDGRSVKPVEEHQARPEGG